MAITAYYEVHISKQIDSKSQGTATVTHVEIHLDLENEGDELLVSTVLDIAKAEIPNVEPHELFARVTRTGSFDTTLLLEPVDSGSGHSIREILNLLKVNFPSKSLRPDEAVIYITQEGSVAFRPRT